MGIKGLRSQRGRGELYVETKSEHLLILLTPTARKRLDEKVRLYNEQLTGETVSRSEFVERWLRGMAE